MPRLNYGTLLENIVVLESARLCLESLEGDGALAFATAFAMPPLTQCWCKPKDTASSPCFTHDCLKKLSAANNAPGSIRQLWSLCVEGSQALPVRAFHSSEPVLLYASAGPNGALLAAMLAAQRRQTIHLWTNDNAERYGPVPNAHCGEDTPPDTLAQAGLLAGGDAAGSAVDVIGWFPDTVPNLAQWLTNEAVRRCEIRLGFLDPDNYAEGQTQVSPGDHRRWLRVLASGCTKVLSATFSGCQNRGEGNAARNERLMAFHSDEVGLFPHSIVFEYGTFQTGVKVRWVDRLAHDVVSNLRRRVESAWQGWATTIGPLTVHVDGEAAN